MDTGHATQMKEKVILLCWLINQTKQTVWTFSSVTLKTFECSFFAYFTILKFDISAYEVQTEMGGGDGNAAGGGSGHDSALFDCDGGEGDGNAGFSVGGANLP